MGRRSLRIKPTSGKSIHDKVSPKTKRQKSLKHKAIMLDITHKTNTLRTALAQAVIKVSRQETIEAVKNKTVPKGDVFSSSKATGLLGIKKTPDLLPDCHPLPIEFADITYEIEGLEIKVLCEIKTIYKTGVEVEAMHGASIVALNIYDMLKPIDKSIEINHIKLLRKKGGKSDFKDTFNKNITAAVIVCSDSVSAGRKEDKAGKAICEKLQVCGVSTSEYTIIPDEKDMVQQKLKTLHKKSIDLIIFTGGTGLSKRDVTPESLAPLLDRRIPGIEERLRSYGQERTPYAMLSRSIVGTYGNTLVLALPGSTRGAEESMDAVFPSILHVFRIFQNMRHD